MKKIVLWFALTGVAMTMTAQQAVSPNGKIGFDVNGQNCVVSFQKQQVMELRLPVSASALREAKPQLVKADYTMVSGKRLHCTNEAHEYRMGSLVLRLYNDGIAFRYEGTKEKEQSAYIIPEGTKRWMLQWSDGSEGFYPMTTTSKVKKLTGFGGSQNSENLNNRWGYPLLMETSSQEKVYALITEANIEKGQSASCLYSDGELFRVVPDETIAGKTIDRTPWRVVIIGTLGDVVESTLVTDVCNPSKLTDTSWIKPGVVSWVYWAYNHGSNDYNIIKKYTDLAATLHLPYVLIDAEWDEMKDGKTIEDAVSYANSKGVKPMIWYNSSVGWINGAPGPKFRLNKPEDREKEFAWCEKIGVAGVKIDFFSGENQMNMDYCQELLESAARHHLLVNFHGATIPRGWQRTWPNLLSTEGVYGAEWYNNVATFTDKAASHNAMLPFTRNVIGPMDYTPCAFSDSQHPHITSNAHELALTVLFESGLQHLADRPESFLAQPQQVQDFLSRLPAAWDETRFVSGYPGESCVIARRSGSTWYVAGINGTNEQKNVRLPLDFIKVQQALLFADGKDRPWNIMPVAIPSQLSLQPRGGFVMVIEEDIQNPMLWADVPDPDVIRVGDTFYMVSTTMHLMPGAPIMRSKDLKNWETVSYIFDKLTDSPKYDLQEGTAYGRGQWATSLKYHNGKFYALLAPNEAGAMGDTYIFSAEKAEGPWSLVSRMRHFHDCSLFFDDDDRVYVVYGTGEMMELKKDLSDVIEGTHRQIFKREADETGLLEGSRMIKHNGKYYLLMISQAYAPGRHRREVCYRADNIQGPYEKAVILESDFGGFGYVGQGTIVDTEEGDWYGIIFQDRGGVGRVLTVSPVRWIDGWPMIGDENGKVPQTMRPYKSGQPATSIVQSDEFSSSDSSVLKKCWQWNHNPIDKAWSLTERPGFLRLRTSRVVPNLYLAPNTLTQRMEGPTCSGIVCVDYSNMKDGDCAGFCAFNGDSGVLTLKRVGKAMFLEMSEQSVQLTDHEKAVTKVDEKMIKGIALTLLYPKAKKIWLRIDGDFQLGHHDAANFYFSMDGKNWEQIGTVNYRMIFDYRRFFMGSKFALFNYATKKTGGYADFDFFRYEKK